LQRRPLSAVSLDRMSDRAAQEARQWECRSYSGCDAMAAWDHADSWMIKILIVLVVFPVMLVAFTQAWKLVLYPVAWLLPSDALWAALIGWSVMVIGLVLAIGGAVWVCRVIWPKDENPV
jgi:hypothetical protein